MIHMLENILTQSKPCTATVALAQVDETPNQTLGSSPNSGTLDWERLLKQSIYVK